MASGNHGRRGPRRLTPDERALWDKVAATTDKGVVPRDGQIPDDEAEHIDHLAPEQAFRDAVPPPTPNPVRPRPRLNGSTAHVALSGAEIGPVGRPEAGLDRRTATRLRKGARDPDARIDLHGMSAERAHRACLTFLADALARGCRVVLVITGKGRSADGDVIGRGRGVLRESLPGWLRASPMGGSIVGIYQAHQKHGGGGAFYVYLKRRR